MQKFKNKMTVLNKMRFYGFIRTTNPALSYKAPSGSVVGENSYSSNLQSYYCSVHFSHQIFVHRASKEFLLDM